MSDTHIRKAYLYSRVSRASQATDGMGIERQVESSLKFLAMHPEYEVDHSTFIQDSGVSAYSGDNISDSAGLGGFLRAVRDGLVERGSLLVIEAPDRLTRLGIRKGQRLFDELAEYGIDVGLVRFGVIIKHDEENDFTSSLIVSIGLYLGHLESKQKSERICATMQKRRNLMREGELTYTPNSPKWLQASPDGKSFEIAPFGKIVQKMFQWRLEGIGTSKISERLNSEGHLDSKGNKFTAPKINQYLRAKSVIGHYQPHTSKKVNGKVKREPEGPPIVDFYPRLIEDSVFYEVQELMDNAKGGPKEKYVNYLRELVQCPCEGCGHSFMHVAVSGGKYQYLRCTTQYKKELTSCEAKPVNFKLVESEILPALRVLDFMSIYKQSPINNGLSKQLKEDIKELTQSIKTDREALGFLKGASRSAVEAVITENERKLSEMQVKGITDDVTVNPKDIETAQLHIRDNPLDSPEKRMEFNNSLKRLIDKLVITPKNWTIHFKGVDLKLTLAFGLQNADEILKTFYRERNRLSEEGLTPQEIHKITGLEVAN
ncbi:site-specific recombinase [Alteromonas mediterranea MED64]|uniref:recombinase family protein n=1 Tax=Alteromonas mediterranea TaxID=314275 RepID=UPI0003558137|nr:recombinase family protein [Alteromonas mediterranea]AGP80804.1 site-specific recombinase [Alteromonas mediterranea MED64]